MENIEIANNNLTKLINSIEIHLKNSNYNNKIKSNWKIDYVKLNGYNNNTDNNTDQQRSSPSSSSPLHRGLFAAENIEINSEIFYENPLIIGPIGNKNDLILCVCCYKIIEADHDHSVICVNKCGLPVCSISCSNSNLHRKECELIQTWKPIENGTKLLHSVLKILTAIRGFLLADEDKQLLSLLQANRNVNLENTIIEDAIGELQNFPVHNKDLIEFLKFVIAIHNTNAFQTVINSSIENDDTFNKNISLKGVYPLTGLLNHQCTPNTRHSVNENFTSTLYATKRILKGEELFTTYSHILWNTSTRYAHLTITKQFECHCNRCLDPTECQTNLLALKCFKRNKCNGILLPTNPIKLNACWKCTECYDEIEFQKIFKTQEYISSIIRATIKEKSSTVADFIEFIENKIYRMVPKTNQFVNEMKLSVIWRLGNSKNEDFTIADYQLKSNYCNDILKILQQLNAGECTMKGLLQFELFLCRLKMKNISNINNNNDDDNHRRTLQENTLNEDDLKLLRNAYEIMKNNVAAPITLHEYFNTYIDFTFK